MAVHHVEDSMQSKNFTFKCHRDGSDVYAVNSIVFHPQCVSYRLHCSIHDSSRVLSECTATKRVHFCSFSPQPEAQQCPDVGSGCMATKAREQRKGDLNERGSAGMAPL